MRLSEALMLGSTLRPKILYERHSAHGTCALGAIEDALGVGLLGAEAAFPQLLEPAIHPLIGKSMGLNMIIADLNNGGNYSHAYGRPHFEPWTREKIAGWLATLEPAGPDPDPDPAVEKPVESSVENREAVCA